MTNKNQWVALAKEVLHERKEGASLEFNATYSFVHEPTIQRIAEGRVAHPKASTQQSLLRLHKLVKNNG